MTENKRFGVSRMIPYTAMDNHSVVLEVIRNMRRSLTEKLLDEIQDGKSYIVSLKHEHVSDFESQVNYCEKYVGELSVKEVPIEQVQVYREWRIVEVDISALRIEAINCKNCAAPIPVGTLDRRGDTLVRCSYCGTYHTIRKRGNTDG